MNKQQIGVFHTEDNRRPAEIVWVARVIIEDCKSGVYNLEND